MTRRTKRVIVVFVVAMVALVVVALGLVGNFLVDFALNPHAEVSMASTIRSGEASGLEGHQEPQLDAAYAEAVKILAEWPSRGDVILGD